MYILRRQKGAYGVNTRHPSWEEHIYKRRSSLVKAIRDYKNPNIWRSTIVVVVEDDDGDLLYYYHARTQVEEIYRNDGSLTNNLEEMGV